MLSLNNLSFYFGSRALYDNVSLHIKPKDRIGLIGPNGTGKSTLLRIITGEYKPDEGSVSRSGDCTIGFLNQDLLSYESDESILAVAMQAFEEANKVEHEMNAILKEMEANYTDALMERLGHLQERYQALDGYTIHSQAEKILEGLGFTTEELKKPLRQFSGGWRMRVMLAKLLLQQPSLLLMDEPTNHLDLPSIQWVEEYLQSYEGAFIVVSHDREFLDNVVTTTVEVSQQNLAVYAGNFSFYLEERELRRSIQQGAFENQQAKIKQTEKFIERFKAKATKAKQVQSRVKALNRLELIDDVIDENAKVNFRFTFKTEPGRTILSLKDISKNYGALHILNHTDAIIERGDKIALIGANGKGKSTLLRIVAGTENADGELTPGHNVKTSFFAQHQLESLNLDNTILEELKGAGSAKLEMELRSILGCFLFTNDDVFKKIKVLSGGEKSRVALAKTMISEANFLLLDEPTNHLDMQSVNILIQALEQYEGTFITVSHDRHFVANIANKIWYIENQEIKEYPGTYDEYETWRADNKSRTGTVIAPPKKEKEKAAPAAVGPKSSDERKQLETRLKSIKNNVTELETKISALEKEKKSLETKMEDPELYQDTKKFGEINKQYATLSSELENLQEDWLLRSDELETIQKTLKA